MRSVDLSILFPSKDKGKVWLSLYLRVGFLRKITEVIALNICAVFHEIWTMIGKNMFSSKKMLNSLPGFTVSNNAGGLLWVQTGRRSEEESSTWAFRPYVLMSMVPSAES